LEYANIIIVAVVGVIVAIAFAIFSRRLDRKMYENNIEKSEKDNEHKKQ